MVWVDARSFRTTEEENLMGIEVEWTDLQEFATVSFRYRDDRVQMNVEGRQAFRDAANMAREAERTRRQNEANRRQQILDFMNQVI